MGNATNRAKGKAQEIGGAIQKNIGKAIGNEKMERKGATRELKGEARQEVAKAAERVKGTVEKAVGGVKSAIGDALGNENLEAEGDREVAKGKARKALNQ